MAGRIATQLSLFLVHRILPGSDEVFLVVLEQIVVEEFVYLLLGEDVSNLGVVPVEMGTFGGQGLGWASVGKGIDSLGTTGPGWC